MARRQLKTGISNVRWCDPANGYYRFENAAMPGIMTDRNASQMSWFDELFYGGIELPDEQSGNSHALTLLITGPPGTGKSTLALEICIGLVSRTENTKLLPGHEFTKKRPIKGEEKQEPGARILYIASEARPEWMIGNARSFGWLGKIPASEDQHQEAELTSKADELFTLSLEPRNRQIALCPLSVAQKQHGRIFDGMRKLLGLPTNTTGGTPVDIPGLDVVVIDSLNTLGSDKAKAYEESYSAFVESGPKLMIFILDSRQAPSVAEAWEFGADIVLRLDKDYSSGYMVRTIEVVKARYQSHVWGRNNLKIHEATAREDAPKTIQSGEDLEIRLRAHPWMEGGIFVFPSIHYILSRFKRGAPEKTDIGVIKTPLDSLTALLGGGIPAGYTTALLGSRGGHKSHLGHLQALYNVKILAGHSIIVSLRDGVTIVKSALERYIIEQKWAANESEAKSVLDGFLHSGALEILNYMPGYVTPEEFFHRMLLSIYRMRMVDDKKSIVLIFNSLDQIASRFPLCAREKVFIPGIIQTLSHLGVTSIFIGADAEVLDDSIHNLLSMAELIIRMRRIDEFPHGRFVQIFSNAREAALKLKPQRKREELIKLKREGKYPITELAVERFAGGKTAGLQGMLELVTAQSLFNGLLNPGLQFIPYRRI
jgi:KaiC/GvpD/RAD55 family RecA-like ATPase